MKRLRRLLPLLLLLIFFAQGLIHTRHASLTFDEGPHLATGYATLRTADLRLQPVHIHPPLANVLAAAPLLLQRDLPDPRTIDGWEIASLSAVTDAVIWQYPHPRRLALAGRLPILLLGVLLGAVIFCWARDLSGWRAGSLALALYAFDPNFIAHGSLITTDVAAIFFGVATLYVLQSSDETRRQRWKWLGVGILLGLAQLAKVSALMLAPVVGVILCVASCKVQVTGYNLNVEGWQKRFAWLVRRVLWIFVPAGLVVWAGYGFEIGAVPGLPFPVPAATHAKIFLSLREHYELGHPTFLLGRVSEQGWWWYFPMAFLLKTPLPVLGLGAYSVFRIAYRFHASRNTHHASRITLYFFPLLYAATSLFSTVNIGYRHLLPLLPFLYIGIAGCGVPFTSHGSRFTFYASHIVLGGLLLWLMAGTIGVAPHYLTYFNESVGGPENGYHYLVDSNLDWGQNLWDLRAWMEEKGHAHVYYAHYSPARPQVYGINADFLPPDPRAVPLTPWHPAPGLYAIGATVLQGPYAPDVNTYAWFRAQEPTARLGNALFLYDVPARAKPGWIEICHPPKVAEEAVRANLDAPTLRVIRPECASAWVYPRGSGIIFAPADASLPTKSPDFSLRERDGRKTTHAYYVDHPPVPEYSFPVKTSGPADFLGYNIVTTTADTEIALWTYWRVKKRPDRPLSLMAHLVAQDGTTISIGDDMGFSIEQWQPDDIIVQLHNLSSGPEEKAYTFRIGGYWLDTLERWRSENGGDYWIIERKGPHAHKGP